ncbi:hypothetical protein [Vibrio metschnikovii]|uniref:hypothetical protein n=1 Tax=Vibrio metschnikovii TaxID=28172 RepID=UPI002FC6733C
MLIDVAIFCILVGFYFWYGESDTSLRQAIMAMFLYIMYLIFYMYIPPFPAGISSQMGQLYGLIPLLSLGAILFPNLNTQSPEVVTRTIGWIGLVIVITILIYFKLSVW